jgi:hypothetical protein
MSDATAGSRSRSRKSFLSSKKSPSHTTHRFVIYRNTKEGDLSLKHADESSRGFTTYNKATRIPPPVGFTVIGGIDNGRLPTISSSTHKLKDNVKEEDVVLAVDGMPVVAAPVELILDMIATADPLVIDVARKVKSMCAYPAVVQQKANHYVPVSNSCRPQRRLLPVSIFLVQELH